MQILDYIRFALYRSQEVVTECDSGSIIEYGPHLPTVSQLLQLLCTANEQLECTTKKLALCKFGLERYGTDPANLMFFTGFSNHKQLMEFFEWLKPLGQQMSYPYSVSKSGIGLARNRRLIMCDEFFLTLCRLHAGLLEQDLADRFRISLATVSRVFLAWLNLLYVVLGSISVWPSRAAIDYFMPATMKANFPNVRVIIDCTEIFTQKPSSLVANSQMYSSYKSHSTFKVLVGIAPHGPFTFISSLFTGSISDVELTKVSGLLDLLQPGDAVMADKGFTIGKLLAEHDVGLVIPHFLSARGQFTSDEVAQNDAITACRVHVERAIRRVKENRILQGIIPLSMLGSINQIWTVCCLLSNFRGSLF